MPQTQCVRSFRLQQTLTFDLSFCFWHWCSHCGFPLPRLLMDVSLLRGPRCQHPWFDQKQMHVCETCWRAGRHSPSAGDLFLSAGLKMASKLMSAFLSTMTFLIGSINKSGSLTKKKNNNNNRLNLLTGKSVSLAAVITLMVVVLIKRQNNVSLLFFGCTCVHCI